jgi:GntR family transcriptional regulator/MocR family aminotransferase
MLHSLVRLNLIAKADSLQGPFIVFLLYHFMGKRATAFELSLQPSRTGVPAYKWLYTELGTAILSGRLRPGARLPATRDLAQQYGLSRGTIVSAFEQLKSEGYLQGREGSGTYVSRILPEELLQVASEGVTKRALAQKPRRRLSDSARRTTLFSGFALRPSRAFRANLPALDLFPTTLWAQIAARRLRRASANFLTGCDSLGYGPLRNAVADYLKTSRGVNCAPEQIVIVSGVQEALDLVSRLFLNPGDRVCMENPGYPGAALAFDSVGAKICARGLDQDGMKLPGDKMESVRLVYVTPGHQFPLGITMSLPRRLQLLEWAHKSRALILEDDYDSEYRYSGRPVPALQGLDRHGLVLFAGSFSKVLFPGLRLGYLVVPHDLIPAVAAAKSITTRHVPVLEQAVLCDFIAEGHFARHLRRMREVYAERLLVLLENARRELGGLLKISNVEAGLQTVGYLRNGINAESAAKAAAARNVEVTPISRYYRGCPARSARQALQLGFAAADGREIRRGVRELALALENDLGQGLRCGVRDA